jgi:hypothetical protein
LQGLATENLGIFYNHLVYFSAIGNILWPFGIFRGHLLYFPCFGILYQEKSCNPGPFAAALIKVSLFRFFQMTRDQLMHILWTLNLTTKQGDQIGRILAYRVIVYVGQFF